MKNEHDLAYDRLCREDIAKDISRYLSVGYDKVLNYLEQHDAAEATKLKANNKTMNFRELKNKDFRSFTDDELTNFLKTVGQYSKDFQSVKLKIAEEKYHLNTEVEEPYTNYV